MKHQILLSTSKFFMIINLGLGQSQELLKFLCWLLIYGIEDIGPQSLIFLIFDISCLDLAPTVFKILDDMSMPLFFV